MEAFEEAAATAGAQLGEAAFAAEWAIGRAMSQEGAIEYALEAGEPQTTAPVVEEPPVGRQPVTLTPREREAAVLVARGLTNRQISGELSVSEKTVHNHVRKILKKLGLRSCAQVAAWVTERRLHMAGQD